MSCELVLVLEAGKWLVYFLGKSGVSTRCKCDAKPPSATTS